MHYACKYSGRTFSLQKWTQSLWDIPQMAAIFWKQSQFFHRSQNKMFVLICFLTERIGIQSFQKKKDPRAVGRTHRECVIVWSVTFIHKNTNKLVVDSGDYFYSMLRLQLYAKFPSNLPPTETHLCGCINVWIFQTAYCNCTTTSTGQIILITDERRQKKRLYWRLFKSYLLIKNG